MPLKINNPYDGAGSRWLRGEIHTHVNKAKVPDTSYPRYTHYGDGHDVGEIYEHAKAAELDFVCMSVDVTSAAGIERFGDVGSGDHLGVTGIPAREIQNNNYEHYFSEEGSDYLHVLTIGDKNGVSICVHPLYYEIANPQPGGHWKHLKKALSHPKAGGHLEGLAVSGMEIYNGFTRGRLLAIIRPIYDLAFDEACWDDMLMQDRLYWGYAGNDAFFHPHNHFESFSPLGVVYAQVNAGREANTIVDALKRGRFYSSTGVMLADNPIGVKIDGEQLEVTGHGRHELRWKAKVHKRVNGEWTLETLGPKDGASATFKVKGDWRYVRIQCEHATKPRCRAWLQPVTNREYFPKGS